LVERSDDPVLAVSVTEGQVMVVAPSGQVRMVRPGQRLTYHADGVAAISPLDANAVKEIDHSLDETRSDGSMASSGERLEHGYGDARTDAGFVAPPVSMMQPKVTPRTNPGAPPLRQNAAPFDEGTVRQWLVAGNYEQAENALGARVTQAPRDYTAWWLLGECRRKRGDHAEAVAAYRQVISGGTPSEANRARYQAAVLLQDRLGDQHSAIALLKEYLKAMPTDRPLDAEARLRLGRGLLALGMATESRAVIEDIRHRYPGTPEAEQAVRLLQNGAVP
jgi:TolA-binding protein